MGSRSATRRRSSPRLEQAVHGSGSVEGGEAFHCFAVQQSPKHRPDGANSPRNFGARHLNTHTHTSRKDPHLRRVIVITPRLCGCYVRRFDRVVPRGDLRESLAPASNNARTPPPQARSRRRPHLPRMLAPRCSATPIVVQALDRRSPPHTHTSADKVLHPETIKRQAAMGRRSPLGTQRSRHR